jgi:hypothetical protein
MRSHLHISRQPRSAVSGPIRSPYHQKQGTVHIRARRVGVLLPPLFLMMMVANRLGPVWLAPTSVWSMTTRLSLMLAENLYQSSPYRVPSALDNEVYPLRWRPAPVENPPDISGLPSIDDALYLFKLSNTISTSIIDSSMMTRSQIAYIGFFRVTRSRRPQRTASVSYTFC